jgi:tetratricopeptide (TPR) repeat protein
MKSTLSSAKPLLVGAALIAAAVLASAGPALAADQKDQKPTVSPKVQKQLHDAQEALKAKKWQEAISKLNEADGVAGKSPYDQHVINEFLANAYINTQNYTEAAKRLEAEVDDGFTPDSEKPQMTRAITEINYQLKNYDKAIEFGNRALKQGYGNEQTRTVVSQAYFLKGDLKGTQKFVDQTVDSQIKAGETPKKDMLLLAYSACQKAHDDGCVTHEMEKLVTYYPQPDYWAQLLYGIRQQTSGNEANLLQTYRLMLDVDVLQSADDYSEMASLAMEQGDAGTAQRVIEKGLAKNIFTEQRVRERNQRLLESAKKQAAADQATLGKQEADANAAPTGQKNFAVGLAYLGYGNYDKAIDQLTKSLSKGSLKSEPQAQLLLGIAQLKGGHKEEAVKAFHAVKGDPALERLASLWSLRAKVA